MKVVPQLITFMLLLLAGWFAYERHEAFQELVDDVTQYAGLLPANDNVSEDKGSVAQILASDSDKKNVEASAIVQPVVSTVTPMAPAIEKPKVAEKLKNQVIESVSESTSPEQKTAVIVDPVVADKAVVGETQGVVELPSATIPSAEKNIFPAIPQVDEKPENSSLVEENPSIAIEEKQQQPAFPPLLSDVESEQEQTVAKVFPELPTNAVEQPGADDSAVKFPELLDEDILTARQDEIQKDRKQAALLGLADARKAWNDGQHEKAIEQYQSLMREYTNHPDFAGELGNIYFSKGETELAVIAYSEAVIRLIKNGDLQRAKKVLGIVYNLDEEQGALLQEHFTPLR